MGVFNMGMDRKSLKKVGAIVLSVGVAATAVVGAVAAADHYGDDNPVAFLEHATLEPVQPSEITLQLQENTQLLKSLEVEAVPDYSKVKFTQLGC